MTGFIVQLISSSFPGKKCFFFRTGGFRAGWRNTTTRDHAHIFETEDCARDAIQEALKEIRYEAPEQNGNLKLRLADAEIVQA